MNIYIYIFIYIHFYIYIYIFTFTKYIYIYIHIYIHIVVHQSMHVIHTRSTASWLTFGLQRLRPNAHTVEERLVPINMWWDLRWMVVRFKFWMCFLTNITWLYGTVYDLCFKTGAAPQFWLWNPASAMGL